MRQRALCSFVLVAILTAAGCASSAPGVRRDSSVLTMEEIATVPVVNLHEAVERLRPRWLQSSADRIAVFMNEGYVGDAWSLREFQAGPIVRLRYLTANEAAATLPIYDTVARLSGVIVLETGDR